MINIISAPDDDKPLDLLYTPMYNKMLQFIIFPQNVFAQVGENRFMFWKMIESENLIFY